MILAEKETIAIQLKEVVAKFNKLEKVCKEKADDLIMLECTLKNRDLEIERLKNEAEIVKDMKKPFNCEECDYSSEKEKDLKTHMDKFHELLCSQCNCTFAGEKKMKNHMCRIHVNNPSSKWFYIHERLV